MNTNVKGNDYLEIQGMSRYIGTKILRAKPMTRLEYNDFREWDLPENEDGSDPGYIVQGADDYVSWSPTKQFHEAYSKKDGLSFGLALEALKKGKKVSRKGWNGKNMWLILVSESRPTIFKHSPYGQAGLSGEVSINTHIDMMTATGEMQPGWLASQTDMLADDWTIHE